MVEGRVTAPEDGPKRPASCWGHREPAYPQCNAAQTHQPTHNNPHLLLSLLMEHNLFHKPPLLFHLTDAEIHASDCEAQMKAIASFSLSWSPLKCILGNSWHVFWPLTLPGHFHFPPTVKQNRQVLFWPSLSFSRSLLPPTLSYLAWRCCQGPQCFYGET